MAGKLFDFIYGGMMREIVYSGKIQILFGKNKQFLLFTTVERVPKAPPRLLKIWANISAIWRENFSPSPASRVFPRCFHSAPLREKTYEIVKIIKE